MKLVYDCTKVTGLLFMDHPIECRRLQLLDSATELLSVELASFCN